MALVGAEADAKADDDSSWALPSALAGGSGLASVRTIGAALRVAKADPARPLGNDGREQLVPLMVLEVATEDLHAVGLTSRALGRALLPGGHSTVAEALEDMAAGHLDSSLIGDRRTPQDLVAEAARLHGLLDLPPRRPRGPAHGRPSQWRRRRRPVASAREGLRAAGRPFPGHLARRRPIGRLPLLWPPLTRPPCR